MKTTVEFTVYSSGKPLTNDNIVECGPGWIALGEPGEDSIYERVSVKRADDGRWEYTADCGLLVLRGEIPEEEVRRIVEGIGLHPDDDPTGWEEFVAWRKKHFPALSFVGPIWVNPVTAYYNQHGHYQQSCIGSGYQTTWEELLSSYADGSLWGIPAEGQEFEAFGEEEWTEYPLGVLVAPERDNNQDQPRTSDQIYMIGPGLWTRRGSIDPNCVAWAFDNPECVEGLDKSPAIVPQ